MRKGKKTTQTVVAAKYGDGLQMRSAGRKGNGPSESAMPAGKRNARRKVQSLPERERPAGKRKARRKAQSLPESAKPAGKRKAGG